MGAWEGCRPHTEYRIYHLCVTATAFYSCSGGVALCCHLLEHVLAVGQSNPQLLVLRQHHSSLFLQGLLLLHLQHTGSQTGSQAPYRTSYRKSDRKSQRK